MNTTEYIWNATASKTFAKSGFTLKLAAYDILGSAKHVYTSINAQAAPKHGATVCPAT